MSLHDKRMPPQRVAKLQEKHNPLDGTLARLALTYFIEMRLPASPLDEHGHDDMGVVIGAYRAKDTGAGRACRLQSYLLLFDDR